jgi:predicted ATPase
MKDHQLVVNVEDFRAVKKAELILDGITVVAGENGCGKSTLSKLLYYLFKTANEYEYYLLDEIQKDLGSISFIIEQLFKDSNLTYNYFSKNESSKLEDYRDYFRQQIESLKLKGLGKEGITREYDAASASRLINIFEITAARIETKPILTTSELIDEIEEVVNNAFNEFLKYKVDRPSTLLDKILSNSFSGEKLPKSLHVLEYGFPIYSDIIFELSRVHTIAKIVYIDTPMIVGLDNINGENEHWKELNFNLRQRVEKINNGNIANIQSKIINGEIVVENDISKRFIYKRSDGQEFDLMSCATGVKSFAILQLLYKNGHLNDKTLLILDEPEVHLHPQWIVEYARLMVLLNKELGVKFFVASHNPDMVSAIKYIAEREQTDANLNFYLAEKEADEFTYTYRHLGTEIDDIFGSFNIAFERINQYGVQE